MELNDELKELVEAYRLANEKFERTSGHLPIIDAIVEMNRFARKIADRLVEENSDEQQ